MNHVEWAKFEAWSTKPHQQKRRCRSCGTRGENFIEVEDKEGIGWACLICCGEEQGETEEEQS